MRFRRQNPYLFLMIWRRNETPKGFEKWNHEEFWEETTVLREDEQLQKFEGKLKEV